MHEEKLLHEGTFLHEGEFLHDRKQKMTNCLKKSKKGKKIK